MSHWYERTQMLLGEPHIKTLQNSHVLIFGIGGVGSYTAEALARASVGRFTLIDFDTVARTNINRQIHATHRTIGQEKVLAMRERILQINPAAQVTALNELVTADNVAGCFAGKIDFAVDAIDMVTGKLVIIEQAKKLNIPVISCMGTGNKLHPEMLAVTDIGKTTVCPLAKVMRKELKKRNIQNVPVCCSTENPIKPRAGTVAANGRPVPASISFVPSAAGLIIAGYVVRELCRCTK